MKHEDENSLTTAVIEIITRLENGLVSATTLETNFELEDIWTALKYKSHFQYLKTSFSDYGWTLIKLYDRNGFGIYKNHNHYFSNWNRL